MPVASSDCSGPANNRADPRMCGDRPGTRRLCCPAGAAPRASRCCRYRLPLRVEPVIQHLDRTVDGDVLRYRQRGAPLSPPVPEQTRSATLRESHPRLRIHPPETSLSKNAASASQAPPHALGKCAPHRRSVRHIGQRRHVQMNNSAPCFAWRPATRACKRSLRRSATACRSHAQVAVLESPASKASAAKIRLKVDTR